MGAFNVGGAAHNGLMMNTQSFEQCERCDGSGADPQQAYHDEVVVLCVDCRGDGVVVMFDEMHQELLLTA